MSDKETSHLPCLTSCTQREFCYSPGGCLIWASVSTKSQKYCVHNIYLALIAFGSISAFVVILTLLSDTIPIS